VAAAVAFSAPAFACHVVVPDNAKPKVECLTGGKAEITWSVALSDQGRTGTITTIKLTPADTEFTSDSQIKVGAEISSTPITGKQVVKAGATNATLEVTAKLGGKGGDAKMLKAATADTAKCVSTEQPTTPPTASPSASASAKPSASSSSSGVAGTSSSSSGGLPVTGANTAAIAGTAVVLVGAGAGLFFVARRRRIKFTA
jgi:hypothetical protein